MHSYKIRGKPGLDASAVQSVAQRFTGDATLSAHEINEDFILNTNFQLSQRQHSKLERLCFLRQWTPPSPSPQPPTRDQPGSTGQEHVESRSVESESQSVPVPTEKTNLTKSTSRQPPVPRNLRVFLPLDMDEETLGLHLKSLALKCSCIEIRSFVQSDRASRCATFLAYEDMKPAPRDSHLEVKKDFLGITPLWDPGADKATVDIVAVPGLGTEAELTFRTKSQDGIVSGDIWLRDYLPHSVENARVLLYGYKSSVRDSDSAATFADMAATLLSSLLWIRKETKTEDRPVILIGHSLGGILIKEMIQRLSSDYDLILKSEKDIYCLCKGFIFFGVPNHGLKNAALQEMALDHPNSPMIHDLMLEKDGHIPQYLTGLHGAFRIAYREIKEKSGQFPKVCVFYETEQSPTKKQDPHTKQWVLTGENIMMVNRLSANLDGIDCKPQPIHTTHSDLVKFKSKTDPNYIMVIRAIEDMVTHVIS